MTFNELYQSAAAFWQMYLEKGPGKLKPTDLVKFVAAADAVKSRLELQPNDPNHLLIVELETLFRRCVERSEGLCYVTGEAGLIPRKDLHERIEAILVQLHSFV